jgi:hypothetical protein
MHQSLMGTSTGWATGVAPLLRAGRLRSTGHRHLAAFPDHAQAAAALPVLDALLQWVAQNS